MNLNNKDWLKFALDLYEKTKDMGLNENWDKKELGSLIDTASNFNFTGTNPPQPESRPQKEEKFQQETSFSGPAKNENNAFWQQDSGPPGGLASTAGALKGGYAPPVSIYETTGEVNVHVILPGIASRDNLTLLLSQDALELSGTRITGGFSSGNKKNENFYRTVRLPAPVNPSEVTATYRNGFLYIRAPKKNHPPLLKIEVNFE